MLDIKFIRENPDKVKKAIKDRNLTLDIDILLKLDSERRSFISEVDNLKNQKNIASGEIAKLLKEKKDATGLISEMKIISQKIDEIDKKVGEIEQNLTKIMYNIPNIPHFSIPIGTDSRSNLIVRTHGEVKKPDFKPKTHTELCELLDIIDFQRASKITGSNFVLYKKEGARLERALINFMLDLHTKKHGYREISPPFLVNRASMTGTGQLPKLEEDMYRLRDDDLFLIPTAEVPVTNIHRDEVLDENKLPIYYAAYSACFRREAGTYGKDTRGLIRVHQFDKVELVKFVKPQDSYDELEKLLSNAEEVLKLLELPYRVVMLSTGDISFAASKCYDIEAWAPGVEKWLEVSSCSNFEDFQARRANIRFKPSTVDRRPLPAGSPHGARLSAKPMEAVGKAGSTVYVHTLNGSGVALARTVIAILENYQQADGSILIPKALGPYMDQAEKISPS